MSTTLTNGHRNSHQAMDNSWSTMSVREFFEHMPWTGIPSDLPRANADSAAMGPTEIDELSLTLTVGEYFNLLPWEGKPNIAVPVAPIDIQTDLPVAEDITLDGFADLF